MSIKLIPLFVSCLLLYACGAGRQDLRPDTELDATVIADSLQRHAASDCVRLNKPQPNTIFVHPGLLMLGIDWGGQRAVDTGKLLVREGFGREILEVRSRQDGPIHQRMLEDEGTRFIGIHYSMGGSPQVLANALQATEQASQDRKQALIYHPIMAEPFDFGHLHKTVNLDSPQLGQGLVLVSSSHSLFRPAIESAPPQVLKHPKLHFVHAEDFGLHWDHFSVLSDLQGSDNNDTLKPGRSLEVFRTLIESLLGGLNSEQIEGRLARLKLRYALQDGRPARQRWLEQLSAGACSPSPTKSRGPGHNQ